jgi:hypothetical protein
MNISNVSTSIRYTSGSGLFGGKTVDWSKVPTKDYNAPPTSDIRSMVRQNARQYANATNDEERTRLKKQADALIHQYVSATAPDRKKLLASAKMAIPALGKAPQWKPKITRTKNAIDYFIEAQNKNKKFKQKRVKEISFDGGSVAAEADGSYTVKLGGEDAVSITPSGITFIPSPAELNAQQEIVDFWNQNRTAATAENQARGIISNSKIDITA